MFWLIYIIVSVAIGIISTYGMIQCDKIDFCWKVKPVLEAIGIGIIITVLWPVILFFIILGSL